jgi:hypothetical protein
MGGHFHFQVILLDANEPAGTGRAKRALITNAEEQRRDLNATRITITVESRSAEF